MKNFLKVVLICLTLSSLPVFSQENVIKEDTLSHTYRYNKARELYVKSLHSESAMLFYKLTDSYKEKLNFFGDRTILTTKEGNLKWVKEHLNVTDFKNYDAAVKEYEAIELAAANQLAENSEFYDYLNYCAMYYKDYTLMSDVMLDVQNSNPELLTLYKKYE